MSSLRNLEDDMRALKFLNLAILSTLVATSAALYAQDEKPPEDKPRQEEPKRQDEAKPADKQDEMKAPRQDETKPTKQEQDKNEQNKNKNDQREQEKQSRDEMKTDRQEAVPQGHARPAGKSVHIPDEKFHAQFGRTHTFRAQRPVVVNGQSRFVYGGYSFVLVDAWPVGAYTDDCYIDYVDGEYFLFDLLHPGVRIALFVVE
jgi:hypothetical protein